MRKFISALVAAVFLAAVPVQASWYKETNAEKVAWAGCKATLIEDPTIGPERSYFSPMRNIIYFGTASKTGPTEYGPLVQVPKYVSDSILFHETGHCLQWQNGYLASEDNVVNIELDADRWSAQLQCLRHQDGARRVHDLFVWAHDVFGYTGDWMHGSLAQRIAAGYSADACKVNLQSS